MAVSVRSKYSINLYKLRKSSSRPAGMRPFLPDLECNGPEGVRDILECNGPWPDLVGRVLNSASVMSRSIEKQEKPL